MPGCGAEAPVDKPAPKPPPRPPPELPAAGVVVAGAPVDVGWLEKRFGVAAGAGAVVLGAEVAELAGGGGLFCRPGNRLGVVEDAGAVVVGAAPNRFDAGAADVVAGFTPPNRLGVEEPVAGGLPKRLLAGAGVVDEAWVLGVLAAGVLLWKLNVGFGVSDVGAGVDDAPVPELARGVGFGLPKSPGPPVLAPAA